MRTLLSTTGRRVASSIAASTWGSAVCSVTYSVASFASSVAGGAALVVAASASALAAAPAAHAAAAPAAERFTTTFDQGPLGRGQFSSIALNGAVLVGERDADRYLELGPAAGPVVLGFALEAATPAVVVAFAHGSTDAVTGLTARLVNRSTGLTLAAQPVAPEPMGDAHPHRWPAGGRGAVAELRFAVDGALMPPGIYELHLARSSASAPGTPGTPGGAVRIDDLAAGPEPQPTADAVLMVAGLGMAAAWVRHRQRRRPRVHGGL